VKLDIGVLKVVVRYWC